MESTETKNVFYSNTVGIVSSQYDIIFDFAQNAPKRTAEGNQYSPEIVSNIMVAMSPQHFKAFVQAVENHLEGYERQFGEINIVPKNVVTE